MSRINAPQQTIPTSLATTLSQPLSVRPIQAAKMLGIQQPTLEKWRKAGGGPRYLRVGTKHSRVLYRTCDLEAWLAEHLVGGGE